MTDRYMSHRKLDIIVFKTHFRFNMDNTDGYAERVGLTSANAYVYPIFMERKYGLVYEYDQTVRYNMSYIPTN
jgi:hypothetical protein